MFPTPERGKGGPENSETIGKYQHCLLLRFVEKEGASFQCVENIVPLRVTLAMCRINMEFPTLMHHILGG